MKQLFLSFLVLFLSNSMALAQRSVQVTNSSTCNISYTLEATDASCNLSLGGGIHNLNSGQLFQLYDTNIFTTGFKLEIVGSSGGWVSGDIPPVFTDDPNCGSSSVASVMMLSNCNGSSSYVNVSVSAGTPPIDYEITITN